MSSEDAQLPPFQSAQQRLETCGENDLDLESEYENLSDVPGQSSTHSLSNLVDDPISKRSSSAEDDQNEESQETISLPSRPNRFHGPPSTWRNRNASERDLAASLDQLQAWDLSVHLYNSFKLGQKSRSRDPDQRRQNSKRSGRANKGLQWIPPKVWTAWPLPPDIVPRESDAARWEEDAVLNVPHHLSQRRPGHHLQGMLVAHILRTAKERFHGRQWEDASQSEIYTRTRGQQRQGLGGDSIRRVSAKDNHQVPGQKPVTMADDQRANEILQATVQHIMTQLDDLLMKLHHARNAYLSGEESGSDSHGQTSERSRSRGRLRKRKRKASKHDENTEASHDSVDCPSSDSSDDHSSRKKSASRRKIQGARSSPRISRSKSFLGRKGRLGLRDWSDVLGVASMLGWNQRVIGSAAARCATLFEECIKFRTLQEGMDVQQEHLYRPNAPPLVSHEHTQNSIWQSQEFSSNKLESAMVGGVHVDGFLEPIEGKKSWMYKQKEQSKQRQSSRISRGQES